jgi:nucleoid-associated protein YgaU
VAFLDLPPSDAPREIGLAAGVPSAETVILAPTPDAPAPTPPVPASRDASAATSLAPSVSPSVSPTSSPPGAEPEAAAPSPVLVSDAEGVRLLAPGASADAAPELLRTVALDAIAYGAEGVALSGRAATGEAGGQAGFVRVYLDGALAAEAPVAADGTWTATLDAPPGLYDLRVDQVDAGGGVESRIAMSFLREERAEVAAALGAAPGEALAVRTVQPGHTLWAIARDRYDEPTMYVRVFEANRDRIRDPDLIYPGQVFVLPDMDEEPASP